MAPQHPLLPRPGQVPLRWTSEPPGNNPRLDPRVRAPFQALAVLSPWRPKALPQLLPTVRLVPVMINHPCPDWIGPAPNPQLLSILHITALGAGMFFFLYFSRSEKRQPTPH